MTVHIARQTPLSKDYPSPYEESDSGDDSKIPVMLPQVLEDLRNCIAEHGRNHERVADLWNSLGLIRQHIQHNTAASIKCHTEALRIYQLEGHGNMSKVAVALGDIAYCHARAGRRKRALAIYQEALELLEKSDIPETNRVVQSTARMVAVLKRKVC